MSRDLLSWHRTFEDAVANWDPAKHAQDVATGEATRKEILGLFPLDGWPSLEVERFAQGTGSEEGDFCTWLESRSKMLGSLPARKAANHIIYKEADEEGKRTWKFPGTYKNVKEAWTAVRAGYVKAFELAAGRAFGEIDGLAAFAPGRLTPHKALHVYFPDRFLPISATNHLRYFGERVFRAEWKERSALGHCALNAALLARLLSVQRLSGATTLDLMWFLYDWADIRTTPAVYKIAPGEGAKYWEDCKKGGYIAVGWEETGALTKFEAEGTFAVAFDKAYAQVHPEKSKRTEKRKEVWQLKGISPKAPGTLILANKGQSRVVGVGKVVAPGYSWLAKRKDYNHGLTIEWEADSGFDVPSQARWGLKTVLQVQPWQFDEILGNVTVPVKNSGTAAHGAGPQGGKNAPPPHPRPTQPLNLILHGPPGTGKTYTMRGLREAFALPAPPVKKQAPAVDVADLTWFQVVALALHELGPSEVPAINSHPLVQAKYVERAPQTKLGPFVWNQLQTHTVAESKAVKYEYRSGQLIFDRQPDGRWYLPNGLPEDITLLLGAADAVAPDSQTHDNQYFVTFHPSFTYEDFVEGIRPDSSDLAQGHVRYPLVPGVFKQACERAVQLTGFDGGLDSFCKLPFDERRSRLQAAPPAVIFIDEINRGNVARVLGELITLIEADKRLGAEQELIVTLPGSRHKFGVPSNLWIIGTMNTADRSVVPLDTALRRRFAFQECPPVPGLLTGTTIEGIDLGELLAAINRRLLRLRDRDHLIGHAFLLPFKDDPSRRTIAGLRRVFREAILPLLLEYFHDDLGRVGLVLGDAFVKRAPAGDLFAKAFDHDHREDLAERPAWELVDIEGLEASHFKAICA